MSKTFNYTEKERVDFELYKTKFIIEVAQFIKYDLNLNQSFFIQLELDTEYERDSIISIIKESFYFFELNFKITYHDHMVQITRMNNGEECKLNI